jgi:hypothetical protein
MKIIVERRPRPRWASAIMASVPPSPLLSARMTTARYLTVTIKISAQKTSETTPMAASSIGMPWACLRASRIA